MRVKYGEGTHLLCRGCKGKVFFTEAEMVEVAQKRLVTVECTRPTCPFYKQPLQYNEGKVEIH